MMSNSENPLAPRIRVGWWLLAVGVLAFAAGWILLVYMPDMERASRFVQGLGIALAIVGAVQVVQYRLLSKDKTEARRIAVAESDERSVLIRLRASTRGFWVAMVMIFVALMWVSATSGAGELLNEDALWYYLAACSVLPFVVYSVSTVYDQRNL